MPAQILVVNDDPVFRSEVTAALRDKGYSVEDYADALAAMAALEYIADLRVLITRLAFAPGRSNGVAFANMVRTRNPGVGIIFTARPEFKEHTVGLGVFMPMPVSIQHLLAVVYEEIGQTAASRSD